MNINVCPPPFFGKMFTKLTDKNRVGPPQFEDYIAHHEHDFELFDWHVGTWSQAMGVCIVQCASLSVFLLNLVIILHYQCNNNWPLVAGIIISENQLDSHTDKTFLIASF